MCSVLFQVNSMSIILPYNAIFFGFTIVKDGGNVVLSTQFGVTVIYDGNHIIFVGIADNYKNKVEGEAVSST